MSKFLFIFLLCCSASNACVVGPYVYNADIISVWDGDSVRADIDLGFHTWRKNEALRLYGIDAPEVKGNTKAEGIKSRDWLRERILGRSVTIKTVKSKKKFRGKFGRYLVIIFDQDCVNLNDELVNQGLAVYREY